MLGYYIRRIALCVVLLAMCAAVALLVRHTLQSADAKSSPEGVPGPSSHVRRYERMIDEIENGGTLARREGEKAKDGD